ncbi:MAG TPA: outer membrane beta-barrel protein [Longimicrobiaceae bacterium]|nr:outer membrane beta-barrel protein [Longimicrobiaceae bacterium]
MKRILIAIALLSSGAAVPAAAQMKGQITLEPYVGYGFFGTLPGESRAKLDAAVAYGGRAAYRFSPQFSLFGNYQRSKPKVEDFPDIDATVDHWSAGVEFSYVPRGGAEGMLPILLEAGVGQARYTYDYAGSGGGFFDTGGGIHENDLAVNLGVASALQLTPAFAIRYGANDYISNYAGDGITNQIFVRAGAEFSF